MDEWLDMADPAITNADPDPWVGQHGWHTEEWNGSDCSATIQSWGSWILMQLQLANPPKSRHRKKKTELI